MTEQKQAVLLRIFVGEYDKFERTPLYEEIVYAAKRAGLAGATVTKGVMSYGANSRIHKIKLLDISEDLPMVIEIVDTEEKITAFRKHLDDLFEKANSGGLITEERVKVKFYGPSPRNDEESQ
jgi:uncharacterized protein